MEVIMRFSVLVALAATLSSFVVVVRADDSTADPATGYSTADPSGTVFPGTYASTGYETADPTAAYTQQQTSGSYGSEAYGTNFFADSANTYYDGYQQSWRYLGWYVKCGYPSDRYDEEENSHDSGGSGDNGNGYEGNNYCQRYLIWAAYVDESYSGGGIGEYYYYDPFTGQPDYSACYTHGNGRCAPMDCHMTNTTTWKLMGVFKEASYFGNDAFFEQLFKHEGVCVWNDDDTYEFMSEARESAWTQGCVNTGVKGNNYYFSSGGSYLYLDLRPTWNGNMTYGLYTDYDCKTEYDGLDVDVDTVSKRMGLLYGDYLSQWNDGLETFKVCQPCRAYNLNAGYSNGNNNGNRRLDGDYDYDSDPNEGYFACEDDADYTNVNQCMKFRTHAELEVATWEDLVTATNQGGILEVNVGGTIFGSPRMSAEENAYIVTKRKKELAVEQRNAARDAATLAALAPQAKSWAAFGNIAFALGAVLAFLVTCRSIRLHCWCKRKIHQQEIIAEPLLLPDQVT